MSKSFDEDGLSFSYPDDWRLEREPTGNGWTVTLQSPGEGASYALIHLDRDMPDPRQAIDEALETLRSDYPALEAHSALEGIGGEMAIGHDIEFFCLDMVVTAWTRSFYGLAGTVFVLCKVTSADPPEYEGILRAVCASMRSEEE